MNPVPDIYRILPEVILTLTGAAIMVVDASLPPQWPRRYLGFLAAIGTTLAIYGSLAQLAFPQGTGFFGAVETSAFTVFFHVLICGIVLGRRPLRRWPAEDFLMIVPLLGAAAAVVVGVYMLAALLRPEKFWKQATPMDPKGWAEIALTSASPSASPGRWAYLARVWQGETTWLDPVLQPVEGVLYRTSGVDRTKGQGWFAYTFSFLAFSAAGFFLLYADPALPGPAAAEPAGVRRHVAGPGVQHGDQLRHQHQLAVLRRRERGQLLAVADGGADRPELRSRPPPASPSPRPWRAPSPPTAARARQLLGRSDPDHPLRAAAHLHRRRR